MTLIYRIIYAPPINFILRNLNKALSPLLPKLKLPPSGVFSFKLKSGKRIRFATNQTDPVSQKVFWRGPYGYEYVTIFEELIAECGTFIDIGSNAGLYSMVAATVNPEIKVLAFDPTDASAHYFQKNIALNGLQRQVHFFQKAITEKKGEITFFEVRNHKYPYLKHNLGGAASAVNKPDYYSETTVESNSLSEIMKENQLENLKLDFIKVDAEGVEPLIIKAMHDLIERDQPIIVCEVLFDQNEAELESLFLNHSYRFFVHLKEGLKETGSIQRSDDNEMRNCFFVPTSKVAIIEKYLIQESH